MKNANKHYKPGENYMFVLPPGWVLVGCVEEVDGESVVLKYGYYIESLKESQAVTHLSMLAEDGDIQKIVHVSYPMGPGTVINTEAVLYSTPIACSLRQLSADFQALRK